jgi:hypothetical protein
MSIISESEIVSAVIGYRILTVKESERPTTSHVTWPQPNGWKAGVEDDLFFEIFQLNESDWKVSLIIKASNSDPIVNQLRKNECLFLKTDFDWELPQGDSGKSTVAIYKKIVAHNNCPKDVAIRRGFDEVARVLKHLKAFSYTCITVEWQRVLDRVKNRQ